jgi:hypothetical protein
VGRGGGVVEGVLMLLVVVRNCGWRRGEGLLRSVGGVGGRGSVDLQSDVRFVVQFNEIFKVFWGGGGGGQRHGVGRMSQVSL